MQVFDPGKSSWTSHLWHAYIEKAGRTPFLLTASLLSYSALPHHLHQGPVAAALDCRCPGCWALCQQSHQQTFSVVWSLKAEWIFNLAFPHWVCIDIKIFVDWWGPVAGRSAKKQSGWRSPHVNLNLSAAPCHSEEEAALAGFASMKKLRRQRKPLPTLIKEKETLWYRVP